MMSVDIVMSATWAHGDGLDGGCRIGAGAVPASMPAVDSSGVPLDRCGRHHRGSPVAGARMPERSADRASWRGTVRSPVFTTLGSKSMGKLQGKVAVITGGTAGIGLAAAHLFVAEGAYVFITGRRRKELDAAVREIGANVTGVQGDVADLADLDRLYETVREEKGRIDIVFANAGLGEFALLEEVTEEHFDKIFDINVKGALFTVQKALPLLNDGGSIILTGSVASAKGTPAFVVYGASKAAVRNFVRGWTVELKERRIRSNVLSPGPIATALMAGQPAEAIEKITSTIPMGRTGETDEVAKAALFLASDDSSFVTGIELFVDGGRAQV
jgi:NAD(P)-dependent dehydrogenase (short-subunit alcohol dehydrogenase family)